MKPPPKKKINRSRIWVDTIRVESNGLYRWEIYHGTILKKSGVAFSPDEAQEEIMSAREILGAK